MDSGSAGQKTMEAGFPPEKQQAGRRTAVRRAARRGKMRL